MANVSFDLYFFDLGRIRFLIPQEFEGDHWNEKCGGGDHEHGSVEELPGQGVQGVEDERAQERADVFNHSHQSVHLSWKKVARTSM